MALIPRYVNSWAKNFSNLNDGQYNFFFFSLFLNQCPVYRIYDKKEKKSYDIYKYSDKWLISFSHDYDGTIDYSLQKPLHPLIPPIRGWGNLKISKMLNHILCKYHNNIAKLDITYDWWRPKYLKDTNNNMKRFMTNFFLASKRYQQKTNIYLPLEMVFFIFNFFRIIDFN